MRSLFQSPAQYLQDLSPETLAELIGAAADIALVVEDGIVKDVALANRDLVSHGYSEAWVGKPWIETVTVESRPKIEALLKREPNAPLWRQVNHQSQSTLDVPVEYRAVPLSGDDRIIALGRDLSHISILQQKLVNAHQELERDYSRLRSAEGRYRILFHTSAEPILIVNAEDWTIEEANTSAGYIADQHAADLVGKPISELFDNTAIGRLNTLIASAATQGSSTQSELKLTSGKLVGLSASAFSESNRRRVILRLNDVQDEDRRQNEPQSLASLLDHLPDGLVIADANQRILQVNQTFSHSAQLASAQDARGAPLTSFLGRSSTDVNVLYASLKKNGFVRNFATIARDRFGSEEKVEVSAVPAPTKDGLVFAFSVRGVSRRLTQTPGLNEQLPNSTTDFTELVGRVPLKEIVSESTLLIERLCIETALKISDNNRASAAEMLGLSRQGLYSKLKRVSGEAGE
ncbi:MAG: transcriptional regulator PpsR [Pseudomonadota bacterium]